MEKSINYWKQKSLSKDLNETVVAIDQLVKVVIKSMDALVDSLDYTQDKLIIAERMSLAFDNYITRLNSHLDDKSGEMKFSSAALLVHYKINNITAENILLDAVEHGDPDHAQVATTILCRVKIKRVKSAIFNRLKSIEMDEKNRNFFNEKLQDLGE
jgi:hypothetical protein